MTLLKTRDGDALFDQMLDTLFDNWPASVRTGYTSAPLDLYEKDGAYVLEMSVPGYDPKEINVEVTGNTVTISGAHAEKTETKDVRYHRREIRKGAFSRILVLPQDLDPTHIIAKIDKGVLRVDLTPVKPLASKKIEVTSA